jgi:uncharacterized protein (TIGR02466 family)
MNNINIFSNTILFENCNINEYNKDVLNFLKEYKKNNKSVIKSNRHGYQTDNITDQHITLPLFKNSISLLKTHYKFNNNVKITLMNLWINENNQYAYNYPHYHDGAHFSGVYYIKVPNNSGKLIFFRESNAVNISSLNDFILEPENETSTYYNLDPKENLLVLFPSHLVHMVEPNYNEQERVSISFNLTLSYSDHG